MECEPDKGDESYGCLVTLPDIFEALMTAGMRGINVSIRILFGMFFEFMSGLISSGYKFGLLNIGG